MELVLTSLIIVSGFTAVSYFHYKHVERIQVLLKAKDLQEVKEFQKLEKVVTTIPVKEPETLQDLFSDMSADQIRKSFERAE